MQWPPTRPGRKGRKFHLVPAASSTSRVSMPSRSKISASSFIRAMFRSRWVFSMTLAASATLIDAARCTPGGDDRAVDGGHDVQRRGVLAGDDLHDRREGVLLVAGVDALGAVAEREVDARSCRPETRSSIGDADLLGGAGVDGGLVDDDVALLQGAADGLGGLHERRQVGLVGVVDRRRHGDDVEVGGRAAPRCGRCRGCRRRPGRRRRPRRCGRGRRAAPRCAAGSRRSRRRAPCARRRRPPAGRRSRDRRRRCGGCGGTRSW